MLPNSNLINVMKMNSKWDIIGSFYQKISVGYSFEKVDIIYNYFENLGSKFTDKELYEISLKIEPKQP